MAEWLLEDVRECAGGVGGGSGPALILRCLCFSSLTGLEERELPLEMVAPSRAKPNFCSVESRYS
jgi:hypothetical protein